MIAYFERTAGTLLIHEFWVALVTQGCSQSAGQPLIKNCPQTGIVVECRIQHFPQLVRDYVTIDTPGTQGSDERIACPGTHAENRRVIVLEIGVSWF